MDHLLILKIYPERLGVPAAPEINIFRKSQILKHLFMAFRSPSTSMDIPS